MLRERYAIFQRGAEWLRRTLIAACMVVTGLLVWTLALGNLLAADAIVIVCLVFISSLFYSDFRLVDLVSGKRILVAGGAHANPFDRRSSGAREIEEMIMLRERRLADLRGRAS